MFNSFNKWQKLLLFFNSAIPLVMITRVRDIIIAESVILINLLIKILKICIFCNFHQHILSNQPKLIK